MRYLDGFRDPAAAPALVDRILSRGDGPPVRIMEVCGTHTMAIARHGIRPLIAPRVALISGPGCPVCVTPGRYIDAAVSLARERDALVATFGDMLKVPGGSGSLEAERGRGADIRVVYSPLDAVAIASAEPSREVVFLGVGFETTAPAIAGAIRSAASLGLRNFSVLSSVRTIPAAMDALAADPAVRIQGFLCPAHVSAIIGASAYAPLAARRRIPCVVAGFEPLDILYGIDLLLAQIADGRAEVENEYSRVAPRDGNARALALMAEVFEPCDIGWRGIGVIPGTGLRIRGRYAAFDAQRKFGVEVREAGAPTPCRCGDVLKGAIAPPECPLFGSACAPEHPVGPCMVSSEGSCAAFYRYGVR